MASFRASLLALLCCRSAVALFLGTAKKDDEGIVCLSVAVYEEEAWVDALLKNALAFAEPTTRIVLHVNSASTYSDEALAKWETERVSVAKERVHSLPFHGSLLWAQMINAQHMDKRWSAESGHEPCTYFAYQASNMMWVRQGFEKVIRQNRFGMVARYDHPFMCSKNVNFIQHMGSAKQFYGWGRPESAFYPMETVRGFVRVMKSYLDSRKNDGSEIIDAKCMLEEMALQTYMVNNHEFTGEELEKHGKKMLTWVNIHYADGKDNDSVPMEEVKAIAEQKEGWEQWYAVKRVNRHLDHPVTKYILSLTE